MDSINNACKLGSDAWLELQAFKTRQLNRREKLNRHKELINGIALNQNYQQQPAPTDLPVSSSSSSSTITNTTTTTTSTTTTSVNNNNSIKSPNALTATSSRLLQTQHSSDTSSPNNSTESRIEEPLLNHASNTSNNLACSNNNNINNSNLTTNFGKTNPSEQNSPPINRSLIDQQNNNNNSGISALASKSLCQNPSINLELVECLLLLKLCDVALKLPIDSRSLQRSISKIRGLENTSKFLVENLLQKFSHQELITVEEPTSNLLSRRGKQILANSKSIEDDDDDESCIYVTSADHTKLVEFDKSFGSSDDIKALLLESKSEDCTTEDQDSLLNCKNIHNKTNNSSHHHQHNTKSVPIQIVRTSASSQLSSTSRDSSNKAKAHPEKTYEQISNIKVKSDSIFLNAAATLDKGSTSKSSGIKSRQQTGYDLESLLSLSSTRERESKKLGEELLELLSKPTAKERNLLERFRSADGYQVREFCPKGTKGECRRNNKGAGACDKLHFKKIIAKHTEESLGDCSFLNTCFHMDSCKYVHYEVDYDEKQPQQHQFKKPHPAEPQTRHRNDSRLMTTPTTDLDNKLNSVSLVVDSSKKAAKLSIGLTSTVSGSTTKFTLSDEEQAIIDAKNRKRFKTVLYPPQWIQCDLRFFDMSLLGKFSVVMADPPWDIHMELPYGTMSDDEMRKLNIPALQDEGVIFLWVTGRAMELGRECLALWGYERCDEIIWVKTNQLQRIIRTGRTGHWLNHGKEHCLVGVKGNPKDINRGLDCDVIVAEVRATSHKPDEIYGIIERLSPGTRKIELFGRAHNVQPNWITLGNQLNGVRLIEPNLVNAFKKLNLPFQTGDHT